MKPFVVFHLFLGIIVGLLLVRLHTYWLLAVVLGYLVLLYRRQHTLLFGLVVLVGGLIAWLRLPPEKTTPIAFYQVEALVSVDQPRYDIIQINHQQFIIYNAPVTLLQGQKIIVSGDVRSLSKRAIPFSFDFNEYLLSIGIVGELRVDELTVISAPSWQAIIKQHLLSQLDTDVEPYVRYFLFGEAQEDKFTQLIQQFSLIDLIVISGLHIDALLLILALLYGEHRGNWMTYVWLIPLVVLLNYPVAIMRSLGTHILSSKSIRQIDGWNRYDMLAIIGILMIMMNPYVLFTRGFIFSFFAAYLVILMQPTLQRFHKNVRPLLFNGFMSLTLLPLIIDGSFEFSLWSPILHLLGAPLTVVLFILALLTLVGLPVGPLLIGLIHLFESSLTWMTQFPLVILFGAPTIWFTSGWLLLWLMYYSIVHRGWKKTRVTIIGSLLILLIDQLSHQRLVSDLLMYFIDVGQGDATLVITPYHRQAVLIDTGGQLTYDIAKKRLIPLLKALQISSLDAVFITHNDFDHAGALTSLQANFPVKQVIRQNLQVDYSFDDVTITNYHELESDSEENEESMVLGIQYQSCDVVIMGDAPLEVEAAIIDDLPSDIDLLRVGHHGSLTSTGEELLAHVRPQLAVISVAKYNRYGHPHQDVLRRLTNHSIDYYTTADYGSLLFRCNGSDFRLFSTANLV